MSNKLTAYKGDVYIPVYGSIADAQVYLKAEADKVIADKDKQLRHHKYKRCEAMAERCETNVYNIRRKPLCDMDDHEGWQHDDEFWQRWHKRWLELAEKFKEAK